MLNESSWKQATHECLSLQLSHPAFFSVLGNAYSSFMLPINDKVVKCIFDYFPFKKYVYVLEKDLPSCPLLLPPYFRVTTPLHWMCCKWLCKLQEPEEEIFFLSWTCASPEKEEHSWTLNMCYSKGLGMQWSFFILFKWCTLVSSECCWLFCDSPNQSHPGTWALTYYASHLE